MKKYNKFIAEVAQPVSKNDIEFRKLAIGKIKAFDITSDTYDELHTKKDKSVRASKGPSDTEKRNRATLDKYLKDFDSAKLSATDNSYKFKVYEDVMDVKLTYSALISDMLQEIHELVETATAVNISDVVEADGIASGPSPDWKGLYRQLEDVRDTLLAYVPTQEDNSDEEDEDMFESAKVNKSEVLFESFKPGALKLEDGNVFSLNKQDVESLNSMLEMMDKESKTEMCKKAKKNKKELHDMIIFSHDLSKLK